MTEVSGTLENSIDVAIASLKVTSEDKWLDDYILVNGSGVDKSPNYLALCGDHQPLIDWFTYLGRDWRERLRILFEIYQSIEADGQKEPILIYKDGRINTGHKRSAILLHMGEKTIKAKIVPDDTKL